MALFPDSPLFESPTLGHPSALPRDLQPAAPQPPRTHLVEKSPTVPQGSRQPWEFELAALRDRVVSLDAIVCELVTRQRQVERYLEDRTWAGRWRRFLTWLQQLRVGGRRG